MMLSGKLGGNLTGRHGIRRDMRSADSHSALLVRAALIVSALLVVGGCGIG